MTDNTIGDQPIEPRYLKEMKDIAGFLDRLFNGGVQHPNKTTGFVLLVFPFGEKLGRCNYISNGADRRDIVTLLREQIARFEGSPDQTGHG